MFWVIIFPILGILWSMTVIYLAELRYAHKLKMHEINKVHEDYIDLVSVQEANEKLQQELDDVKKRMDAMTLRMGFK